MSEQLIILVPTDPFPKPDDVNIAQAVSLLKPMICTHDRIDLKTSDKPQFFHAMENFESVHCPGEAEPLDMEWWGDKMDRDFDGKGFRLALFEAPCATSPLTLNDLEYQSPAAFGVLAIEVVNPSVSALSATEQLMIEKALASPVRQVFAHI